MPCENGLPQTSISKPFINHECTTSVVAYKVFDVDEDGVVGVHDVFELMRMNVHELVRNDFSVCWMMGMGDRGGGWGWGWG